MKTLYTAIVGSKLHGLDTPSSDTDIRSVHSYSAREMLDPFSQPNDTIENKLVNDSVSYEIQKFVKMCVKGNPTALEILWSNLVECIDPDFQVLKDNKTKFLDSVHILNAHIGYIWSQIEIIERHQFIKAKAYVTGERVFAQCWSLLSNKDFSPRLSDDLIEDLLPIKMLNTNDFEKGQEWINALKARVQFLKSLVELTQFTPDYKWISSALFDIWGV